MTIGPAPMMRMLSRSVLFGTVFHHLGEAIEQISNVMRTRTRFGVTLKTKRWSVGAGKTLEGTVEERNVRRPQGRRNRGRVYGKTVILAGDDDLPGIEVLHRMV